MVQVAVAIANFVWSVVSAMLWLAAEIGGTAAVAIGSLIYGRRAVKRWRDRNR